MTACSSTSLISQKSMPIRLAMIRHAAPVPPATAGPVAPAKRSPKVLASWQASCGHKSKLFGARQTMPPADELPEQKGLKKTPKSPRSYILLDKEARCFNRQGCWGATEFNAKRGQQLSSPAHKANTFCDCLFRRPRRYPKCPLKFSKVT